MSRERVLIAMSGGVDSSVAALRLHQRGYEVVGVTLHLWDYPTDQTEKGRCCAPEDQYDARRVADALGIPHYTFDRRELFKQFVVDPFISAYLEGTTPSPCVSCNRTVKMRELFVLADRLGARYVATGHYARVVHEGNRARLYRGRDRVKDQSYFLHMLTSEELSRMLFPLGDATKEEVRKEALERRLHGAEKGESQELCFVPNGRYEAFVEKRAGDRKRPGPILNDEGRVVGAHEGIFHFTIGQRKGLGVALGKPAFVVGIDANTHAIRLGNEAQLGSEVAVISDAVWSDDVKFPLEAEVRVRARHDGEKATVVPVPGENRFRVQFERPVRAISPGQIAVAYRGERVLGGGAIVSSAT